MKYVTSVYLPALLYAVEIPPKLKAKDEMSKVAGKCRVCIVFHFITSGVQKASVHFQAWSGPSTSRPVPGPVHLKCINSASKPMQTLLHTM